MIIFKTKWYTTITEFKTLQNMHFLT